VVDNGIGAKFEAPFLRLRARGGGHHRQSGEAAGKLDQYRADAAGAADDQKRARIDASSRHRAEPVEQQFPGGDRGQRQRRGFRKRQALRLAAYDAFVNQVKLRIGALAENRAGIENFIAGLEQRRLGTDRIDDTRGVIAEDLGFRPLEEPRLRTL